MPGARNSGVRKDVAFEGAPQRAETPFGAESQVGAIRQEPGATPRRERPAPPRAQASRAVPPPPAAPPTPRAWEGRIEITPDRTLYQRFGKRFVDVLASGVALLLLSPLFLAIIIAIKLEDGGPILYCSERVGRGGRCFRFLKFRSMIPSADSCRDSLQILNEVDGPVFKIENDPRITRVGRILRRTSMDELPQFWNVFRGDMSCVGPRPPIPSEVENYEPWQLERLSVRPGITCLWQISGRSRIGFDEWMRLDMEYIHHHRTLSSDLNILLRTVPAVVSGEGAY